LAGAGLDVTDPEPLPADSPLWAMENVLITAHTSGATPRLWDRSVEILIVNLERFRRGEPLLNLVDPTEGY
jgi:phosphoglycerate dehydrogenase-like enzyme